MNESRRLAGWKAQQAGSTFEAWVESQHEVARRLGIIAHVAHNEPHGKIINGRIEYVSAGVADYTGTLEGGKTLAVEAKSTKKPYLARSVISPKQQEHLDCVARAGGLALLLVEFRVPAADGFQRWNLFQRHAVPWLEVPWMVKKTAESVGVIDLDPKWNVTDRCYLLRWQPIGPRSNNYGVRRFARE